MTGPSGTSFAPSTSKNRRTPFTRTCIDNPRARDPPSVCCTSGSDVSGALRRSRPGRSPAGSVIPCIRGAQGGNGDMNFDLTPDQQQLQARVRDFAQAEVAPVAETLDRDGVFP